MGPMWYFGDGNGSLETSVVGKNVGVATVFRKPDADVASTSASWNLIKIPKLKKMYIHHFKFGEQIYRWVEVQPLAPKYTIKLSANAIQPKCTFVQLVNLFDSSLFRYLAVVS